MADFGNWDVESAHAHPARRLAAAMVGFHDFEHPVVLALIEHLEQDRVLRRIAAHAVQHHRLRGLNGQRRPDI